MQKKNDILDIKTDNIKLHKNKRLRLWEAFIPIIVLVILLAYNVYIYKDDATSGPNQFALIFAGVVAAVIGFIKNISYSDMLEAVVDNVKSTGSAIFILLMVGALAGTWLISGIIPTMIFYGLKILNPTFFLAAALVICCIISLATGSSWTTTATIGIALMGIGKALGFPLGMIAGAVLSGAYFGDKMSPLSDTTNLAPAMAGTDVFTHVKYMAYTTIPTIIITLIIFLVLGFQHEAAELQDNFALINSIQNTFNITPLLFIVPIVVIVLIVRKAKPLTALFIGTILAGIFAVIFQPEIIMKVAESDTFNFNSAYKGVMNAMTNSIYIPSGNAILDENELFSSGGMSGMLSTIWLILCAMFFGGIMQEIGALQKISDSILKIAKSTFGLFASTTFTCIFFNGTASDQYLAIVVPGKMYQKAFKDKGLAPENLSRTLEDSGTVTSILFPWNTGGAYQSKTLGVGTGEYVYYAFFNLISPIMTLIFAYFNIKIRKLTSK
ncbi:Na+/H+ antiporter NhaC [Yeosuana marina]|uniref:Na+/H+ antiporter NhaC n=1 Tax=Yeosuana marina TaxID=1565536 RepID=UPI001422926A|nr:Na+/H+ antiporter NhaC [Yeosuana marina]|tara:strand:+ start:1935 stop:3425 length:1491 start_codon:yes stop_codon:yes gene_type:complete